MNEIKASLLSDTISSEIVFFCAERGIKLTKSQVAMIDLIQFWQSPRDYKEPYRPTLGISLGQCQGQTQLWLILAEMFKFVTVAFKTDETKDALTAGLVMTKRIHHRQVVSHAELVSHKFRARPTEEPSLLIIDEYHYNADKFIELLAYLEKASLRGLILA